MADAWELLVAESSLPEHAHDAWEHLESVKAGGGGLTVVSDIEVEMDQLCFEVETEEELIVETAGELEVEVNDDELEVEVCA